MRYTCPLCGQPVSPSLYQKITGIWKERQKALARIREQRAKLLKKIGEERERLRKQTAKFRKEKPRLIRQAVDRRTRRLEFQIKALKGRGEQIERRAQEKIRRATALANSRAEKVATDRFNSMKKQLHASLRDQLGKERERYTQEAEKKYKRLDNTFRSTLGQMKIKNRQLRQQERDIRELENQLKRQTTAQIEGLLYEKDLVRELRKRFPEDKFQHTGKGGDVIHSIIRGGRQVGLIVYECKRVKHYSAGHVKQAAEAKEKRKADFAILVTNAMKKGTQGFFTERGVIIVHPAGLLSISNVLRSHIVRIAEMKLGQLQRDEAVKLTLEYLEGPEFTNSMDAIILESISLYKDLLDEMEKHKAGWKRRYSSYKKVCEEASTVKSTSQALLSGQPEYKKLIRTDTLPALVELPKLKKPIDSRKSTENADRGEHGANDT